MLRNWSIATELTAAALSPNPVVALFGKAWTIAVKDIRVEVRRREAVATSLVFALIALVIFNIALNLERQRLELLAPGLLWVTIVFAGVLILGHSFMGEKEQGALVGVLVAPVDRSAIYLGKVLSTLVFLGVMGAVVLPLTVVLFNLPLFRPVLFLVLLLGTLGFSAVGVLFSVIVAGSRTREALLPILLLPVVLPVVVASVEGTALVLQGKPLSELMPWLGVLGAFDAIFLSIGAALFELVLEGSDV